MMPPAGAVSGYEVPQLARLLSALQASPTGMQLTLGGPFVFQVLDHDPRLDPDPSTDGVAVLWEDATTGDRFLDTFMRSSGWKKVQVS